MILAIRFTKGLAATTNLTHTNPWGLWIGFDVMSGVALAAGGFVTSSAVYLFGMKEYKPIVRPAILTGFLGYFLVVLGLLADLGRPVAPALPVHQAGRTHLAAVRGRPVRRAVPDRAVHRVDARRPSSGSAGSACAGWSGA